MQPAYEECNQQKGTGMFQRMKLAMDKHLDIKQQVIFSQSAHVLLAQLASLQGRILAEVGDGVHLLKAAVQEQYAPFWASGSSASKVDSRIRGTLNFWYNR
jgi:hypothetical protein